MLLELNVKNIALIDSVSVEFGKGLNILTGETGAGKSVLIDSVMLALGGRIRPDIIRTGEESAYVELILTAEGEEAAGLRALGVELEDDGIITITRKIMPGRSVSRINGESVTLTRLREAASLLLDIYGQNEYHTLLSQDKQLELLDAFIAADAGELTGEVRKAYLGFEKASDTLAVYREDEKSRLREQEILSYELSEIDRARLKEGEEEELLREFKRLSNLQKILERLGRAREELKRLDIARVAEDLGFAASYDEELKGVYDEVLDMEGILDLILRDISVYAGDLDNDEGRLSETEKRLDEIRGLEAKYGQSIADIMAYREKAALRLDELKNFEQRKAEAESAFRSAENKLMSLSAELSRLRKEGAGRLSDEVSAELSDLAFKSAVIDIEFHEVSPGAAGIDQVMLVASLNPGEPLKPLSDIASGGELSRVMLAIKTVLARTDHMPTLIFDEIDAGISGRTAQVIAEKMASIALKHQVIAVSHLPQIAAMADTHFVIEKEMRDGKNLTRLERLDSEGEILELSRLLGGSKITEAVYNNAAEMKRLADRFKKGKR